MSIVNDVHARMQRRLAQTDERAGQAAFNALLLLESEVAELVRGSDADPFYSDELLPEFWTWLGGLDR